MFIQQSRPIVEHHISLLDSKSVEGGVVSFRQVDFSKVEIQHT